jgi:tRNA A-37 threonylcarbamoyl transferase component Bud32
MIDRLHHHPLAHHEATAKNFILGTTASMLLQNICETLRKSFPALAISTIP